MSDAFKRASKVFGAAHNFMYGLGEGVKLQKVFLHILSDEPAMEYLKRGWNIDVSVQDDCFEISSPIGKVHGEFVTSMDETFLCRAVIFHDIDTAGEKRDLYAVRLTNEPGHWIESDGSIMATDAGAQVPHTKAMVQLLLKVLTHKLVADDDRVAKLSVRELPV